MFSFCSFESLASSLGLSFYGCLYQWVCFLETPYGQIQLYNPVRHCESISVLRHLHLSLLLTHYLLILVEFFFWWCRLLLSTYFPVSMRLGWLVRADGLLLCCPFYLFQIFPSWALVIDTIIILCILYSFKTSPCCFVVMCFP